MQRLLSGSGSVIADLQARSSRSARERPRHR